MKKLWVVIANRSYAEIYEVLGQGKHMSLVSRLDNPDGRKKDGELTSDRPGRTFGHLKQHSEEPKTLPHDVVAHEFAHEIIKFLLKEKERFSHLALVAPAHMLSELRKGMPGDLKKCVEHEVKKDLPEFMTDQERQDHIARDLNLWNR